MSNSDSSVHPQLRASEFGRSELRAAGGRLFVREVGNRGRSGISVIVGVVELPKDTPCECLMPVAVDRDGMFLDAGAVVPLSDRHPTGQAEVAAESDANNLLTGLKFHAGANPGVFEAVVRQSVLPHKSPALGWFIVAGIARHRLEATPRDGLYELPPGADAPGLRLVESDVFVGLTAGQVLRETLWGEGGRYGLSTSMEPDRYPAWLSQERASPSADPMYALFLSKMPPAPLFYTAEESMLRDRQAATVIREIRATMMTANSDTPDTPDTADAPTGSGATGHPDADADEEDGDPPPRRPDMRH